MVYPRKMSRSRRFCGTVNNPAGELSAYFPDRCGTALKFASWQLEKAPTTGTLHLQYYLVFNNARTLAAVRRDLPGAHVQVCNPNVPLKESDEANFKYTTKDKNEDGSPARATTEQATSGPWIFGERLAQGKRSDIAAILEDIREGKTEVAIAEENPGTYIRYYKGFERYRSLIQPKRDWQTTVTVFWGPPGSGKTKRAYEEAGADAYWLERPNQDKGSLWFDGYTGQENVIIDEFYGWISNDRLQRIIDRYPLRVQNKGASVQFVAKRIWITSNKCPRDWWPLQPLGAMARRLRDPIGTVVYIGDEEHPTEEDWLMDSHY